jgi:hypothetical protein
LGELGVVDVAVIVGVEQLDDGVDFICCHGVPVLMVIYKMEMTA